METATAPQRRLGFIARNIEEIRGDTALRIYGACLAVPYLATVAFMLWQKQYLYLTTPSGSICWPLLPDCRTYHVLTVPAALAVLGLLGILALATAVAFLAGRVRDGWFLLLGAFALDGLIICQDFRFRLNEHTMLLWATAAFLLVPHKRRAVSFLVVSFYFWAGRIKLNPEWLSGWELPPHRLWLIPDSLYPAACTYVVVLEMVLVWALVQRRRWLFWTAFAQFVLFHALSWSIVGFFYPILMAGIISLFPLRRVIPDPPRSDPARPDAPRDDLSDLIHLRLPGSIYGLLAAFGLLQLVPFLYPGDPAWTSQGRLLSLHMFEGRSHCKVWATKKFDGRPPEEIDLYRRDLVVREQCDPLVYFDAASDLCRDLPGQDPSFRDLDLHMLVSKRTSPTPRPLIDTDDFCSKHLRYNAFMPNRWILPLRGVSTDAVERQ